MAEFNTYNDFKKLEDVFKDEAFSKFNRFAKEYEAVEQFGNIFPELKQFVIPKKVEKGVLILKVENSVLRNELKFKSSKMISKINEYLSDEVIKSIRFTS